MGKVRDSLGPQIKQMAAKMSQAQIAVTLKISRQLVSYHLSDKSRRRRAAMPRERVAVLRQKANARTAAKALRGVLE